MAAQVERKRPVPVCFKKKRLTPEIKRELQELKNAYEEEKGKIKDAWQATINVVKERHETNFALTKSKLLDQNQESGASKSDADSRREDTVSGTLFTPENRREAVEFYRIWTEEFRKNAFNQREMVRDSVEKWFAYLHRFDKEEEKKEEKVPKLEQSLSQGSVMKILRYCLVVILIVTSVSFILKDHTFLSFGNELFICLREYITPLALKILDSYFKFHRTPNDYSNVSDTIQKLTGDASGS